MNREIEEEIIKKYVKKNKQERILWEINNPKKRKGIIWHFDRPDIFKGDCLQPVEYMDRKIMKDFLIKNSNLGKVYFIGESFIGYLSSEEAAERANTGEICIIYCGNGIGYYQGEQEKGKPPRFLLK